MSEPQFADPAVSRRKFDREIAEFRSQADEYRRRGWLLADAEFPHALVILATVKTQPISILCGVWFDYSNYDAAPPSVRLVHPLTREPYKWSEVPTRLPRMPAPPGVAQALPPTASFGRSRRWLHRASRRRCTAKTQPISSAGSGSTEL